MCLFCNIDREIIFDNKLAYAIYDGFPVAKGHILVIPKRHIETFFEATQEEVVAMYDLISSCKQLLDENFKPDGYNIGINIGEVAGQSVFHLHIHLIPRYKGDCENPRGGVRNIVPHKCPLKKKV